MILPRPSNPAPFDEFGVAAAASRGAGLAVGPSIPPPTNFDPTSEISWCELILGIVATANSGGGSVRVICDGPSDAGALSAPVIVERLAQYADSPFDDLKVRTPESTVNNVFDVAVGPAECPIGFRRSSPHAPSSRLADGERIFSAGVFYFRRGDKCVAGTSADLRAFLARMLDRERRRWLRGIRRVIGGPIGLQGTPRRDRAAAAPSASAANLQPVRIVNDPGAPALQPQYVDRLYPWRQKDLLDELNHRLARRALTTYDIQAVRRQHRLDDRPDFVFHLPGAGRRYSPAVADWMMEQFNQDASFFEKARAADQAILRLRRQKPR
jgi:hypothetical protein